MKKEIVINASKDRSRIAIVEDGDLVELYVEHPDNVRTLGNIYLARIRKIMPGIRAAFVDIGQKQDAFLHFSDLTDNLPALLALAGEKIPGVEALPLAHAPQKRIADDENEPAPEEVLDIESASDSEDDEEKPSGNRRSRGGRSNRRGRGGRRRGGRRREEEEEQEEAGEERRPSSPFVIDLTLKTGKVEPKTEAKPERRTSRSRSKDTATADSDAPDTSPTADDAKGGPDTAQPTDAKPTRRTSRRRSSDADAKDEASSSDGAASGPSETAPESAEPSDTPKRSSRTRKPRQRQSSKPTTDDGDGATGTDAEASDSDENASQESASRSSGGRRRRRGRRGGRRRRGGNRGSSEQTQSDDAQAPTGPEAKAEEKPAEEKESKRSSRGRGRQKSDSASETASDTSEAQAEEAKAEDTRSQRGRSSGSRSSSSRSSGRGRSQKDDGADETKDDTSGRARSRGGDRSSSNRSGRSSGKSEGKKKDASVAEALAKAATDRPEEFLRRDGSIPVKITKEPISSKGSRVSTDISLAGRFLVLVPAADYVAVSKKIESAKERRRLKSLASSLKPAGCGVIVRTVAEGRDAKTLDTDLRLLIDKWRKIQEQIRSNPNPPSLLYEDVNMVSSIIRDLFTEDYDRILIDDPKLHKNVKAYVQAVAPHMAEKVVLHRSNTPVFRSVGIEKAVEQVFSTRVPLPSGGYLFIEHTEAMHVVDVNSGRAGRGKSQSENLLAVNLEAAREVAKQLRLRDLGGIIVVDFIDMRSESDRRKVYNELKTQFKRDRAVTKLLPMSDFGLIEITRQRLRPSITTQGTAAQEDTERLDPQAAMEAAGATEILQPDRDFGSVKLDEPVTSDDVVERLGAWFKHYRETVDDKYRDRPVVLQVHPLLASHLRRGFPSLLTKLRFRNRPIRFRLDADPSLHPLDFEVNDEKSGKPLKGQYMPSA